MPTTITPQQKKEQAEQEARQRKAVIEQQRQDKTSLTRDVSQEVWEAMGGTGPAPSTGKPPTPPPTPQPTPSPAQTKDVTQINRGSPPPPGWKVSDTYASTPETGPVYEDKKGKTYVMVGTNQAGRVYMEIEKAKAGTPYYDPVALSTLRRKDPYLYTKIITEGEKGLKEALSKRAKDIKAIQQRQEVKQTKALNQLRKYDPYLYKVYMVAESKKKGSGQSALDKAIKKRETDIKAISERAQARAVAKVREQIKDSPIKLQVAFERGGIEAYNKAVAEWNAMVEREKVEYQKAIDSLKDYKKDDGYLVSEYLKDNPERESLTTLEKAGFDKDVVKQAREYIDAIEKAEKGFKNKKKDTQVFIVGQALGFRDRQKAAASKDVWSGLSKEDKQKVISEYIKGDISPSELKKSSLELLKQEWIEAAPIYILAGLGATATVAKGIISPIAGFIEKGTLAGMGGYTAYETVKNWDEMTKPQRALNIAVATLLFIPASRAIYRTAKIKFDPLGTRVNEIIKTETAANKKMASLIKKEYGIDPANKLMKLNKAQSDYMDAIVQKQKGKKVDVDAAGIKLEKAAREYTEAIKTKMKVDDPGIAKAIEDLPKEIKGNIEAAIEAATPTKQRLKTAKAELKRAEAELKKAQTKWPTQPGKWADLVLKYAVKENNLNMLQNKQGFNYQVEIRKLKDKLSRAKSKKERDRILSEINKLTVKYDRFIKSLEVEYGRGGQVSPRGGRVAILTSTRKTRGGFKTELRSRGIGFKIMGGGVITAKRNEVATIKKVRDFTLKTPLTVADINWQIKQINMEGELNKEDIKTIVQSLNEEAYQAKVDFITKQKIQEKIREKTETKPEPKPAMKLEVPAKPSTKVKTKIQSFKPKGKMKPIFLDTDEQQEKKRKSIKESLGAVTYRRGELNGKGVWHTYHIDRGGELNRTVVVGPAPEGARVATGKGSTTITLKKIRGKRLPNFTVIADTGAVDDVITASGGKLTLTHVPDRISGGGMKRISNGIGRLSPKTPKLR